MIKRLNYEQVGRLLAALPERGDVPPPFVVRPSYGPGRPRLVVAWRHADGRKLRVCCYGRSTEVEWVSPAEVTICYLVLPAQPGSDLVTLVRAGLDWLYGPAEVES